MIKFKDLFQGMILNNTKPIEGPSFMLIGRKAGDNVRCLEIEYLETVPGPHTIEKLDIKSEEWDEKNYFFVYSKHLNKESYKYFLHVFKSRAAKKKLLDNIFNKLP